MSLIILTKYQIASYSESMRMMNNMLDWCADNYIVDFTWSLHSGGRGYRYWSPLFVFNKPDDAALFKLTWG